MLRQSTAFQRPISERQKKKVLHGIGQGNGGGPAMWISHLTVMFSAISSVCLGFAFSCIQQLHKVSSVGTGYVDDVTLGLSIQRDQKQTESMVLRQIKRMAQLWEQLLYISGGRLELSKCFWVPVIWTWKKGRPTCTTKLLDSNKLYLIESETGDTIPILKLNSSAVEKRLGIRSSCNNKWTSEFRYWLQSSQQFGRRVRGAGLGRTAGYLAYHTLWLSKFRYSAPVVGFSIPQLKKIQQGIIGPCLSASGYCNKMPRAVVHGPELFGGMAWENISLILLYEKLKMFIGSVRLQDTVGSILVLQLSWLQLFAGISTPLLEFGRELPFLPTGWIVNLHQHLVHHQLQVEMALGWLPTKQRINDRIIMDLAVHSLPHWTWDGINRCRIYLAATTVADISTLDGQFIPADIRRVKRKLRDNKLQFPAQSRPSKQDIEQWNYLLDSISDEGHLHVRLGEWNRLPDQIYNYMANTIDNIVYKRLPTGWLVYGNKRTSSRRLLNSRLMIQTIPTNSIPVRVIDSVRYLIVVDEVQQLDRNDIYLTGLYSHRQSQMEQQIMGKFQVDAEMIKKLNKQWHTPENIIVGATDGGLKSHIGTSSYAIFLRDNTTPIVTGYAGEYQPRNDASSTRQELLGQLGLDYWLQRFQQWWGRPRNSAKIILVTDSQASIEIMAKLTDTLGLKDVLQPEMDVALEIYRRRIGNPGFSWEVQKVQSHISLEEAPDEFFWVCNEIADTLATTARSEWTLDQLQAKPSHVLLGARAGCRLHRRIENNHVLQKLKDDVTGNTMKLYLMEKYDWSVGDFDNVAWIPHQRELKKISRFQRVTLLKYIHGWLATNKRRRREGGTALEHCIYCGAVEDRKHIFTCTTPQWQHLLNIQWNNLASKVLSQTDPAFAAIFRQGLDTVRGKPPADERTMADWPLSLRKAYDVQVQIGWEQVLYGRLARHWEESSMFKG